MERIFEDTNDDMGESCGSLKLNTSSVLTILGGVDMSLAIILKFETWLRAGAQKTLELIVEKA